MLLLLLLLLLLLFCCHVVIVRHSVRLCSLLPVSSAAKGAVSYFDRLWAERAKTERYTILLRKL